MLRKAFTNLGPDLFGTNHKFLTDEVYISDQETAATKRLNNLVSRYPTATFGSYPEWFNPYYKTKITVECDTEDLLEEIVTEVRTVMTTVNYDKEPEVAAMDKMERLLADSSDEEFNNVVIAGMKAIEECFDKYSPQEVCVCFNGGKDCIVMLHLVWAHLQKHYSGEKLRSLYIREKKSFNEVDEFIDASVDKYQLNNTSVEGPMKSALAEMLVKEPTIKAFV